MKLVFSTLLFLFFCGVVLGQFGPERKMLSHQGSTHLSIGDIDNDGDLDVLSVISSIPPPFLGWYESYGNPDQYKRVQSITSNLSSDFGTIKSPLLVDINGDTFLDIVLGGSKLIWLENLNGDGVFVVADTISNFPGFDRIFPADIDNDGDVDLIVKSYASVSLFINEDGFGDFGSEQVILTNVSWLKDLSLGDIDGDGDIDLVCAFVDTDEVYWYENENGSFGQPNTIGSGLNYPKSLSLMDINSDNNMDVVVLASNGLFWFDNVAGNGDIWSQNFGPPFNSNSDFVTTEDFDGDGDYDLLVSSLYNIGIAWYENEDGNGGFGPKKIIAEGGSVYSLLTVDFDNDGDFDIVSTFGGISWFENETGTGNFGDLKYIEGGGGFFAQGSLMLVDLDNDGDVDILNGGNEYASNKPFLWTENIDGQGEYGGPKIIENATHLWPSCYGDLNGDSLIDVLVSGAGIQTPSGAWFVWYENSGSGEFGDAKAVKSNFFHSPNALAVADFDNDGDNDIVYYTTQPHKMGWFENTDGLGSFDVLHTILESVIWARVIIPKDIDNDGDIDLIIGAALVGSNAYLIGWIENEDGNGNFGDLIIISNEVGSLTNLITGDVDNDGYDDLITASSNTDKIAWYKNIDGSGNFASPQIIITNIDNPTSIAISDIDLDGDKDLIVTSDTEKKIYWFENVNGAGVFGAKNVIASDISSPLSARTADIDNDGIMDLVVTFSDSRLSWYKNLLHNAQIIATPFLDENQNGSLDFGEIKLQNQNITLSPNPITSWSNSNGQTIFYANAGQYDLTYYPSAIWALSTTSTYSIEILQDSMGSIIYEFGVIPAISFSQTSLTLTSAPTRCGFTVPFWLHYENTGTQTASGIVSLDLDPLVTFVSASPAPDSIDGSQYFWFLQNLYPTYTDQVNLELLMPDVSFLGETIEMKSRVILQEGGADVFESSHQFSSVINCSYDPNDKLVEPNIPGNSNYTLFGDTLIYTVRFQNTGTDTAINIRIEDVLDHNLDWSTFRVIAASHDYNVYLKENGRVEFFFNNIYLPDSTVNEIASHGFVKYRILANDGLPENTVVDNFASIFFDFNPPILTNTVFNELVSKYPLELHVQSPLCHDSADGIVSVSAISPEPVFYNWDNGQTGTILTGLETGEVSLTVTNEAGQVVADTSFIVIAPAPITLVTSSTPANGTNADGTATVTTEGGTPPFSYEWNSQPVQTDETATGLLPGVYAVVATDANGCTEQTAVIVEQATSVKETEFKWQFNIRPNPSSGTVNIDFQLDRTTLWKLQVYNSAGQIISEFFAPQSGSSNADLLLEDLDPGIYHLSLHAQGKVLSKKLVVFEK